MVILTLPQFPGFQDNTIAYIISPIVLILLLVSVVVVVLGIARICRPSTHQYSPNTIRDPNELAHLEPVIDSLPPSPLPPIPQPIKCSSAHKVVVVFSDRIAERNKELIHVLVCTLNKYPDISALYYEIAHRQATSSWIEDNVDRASAVLAVCDHNFKNEWQNGGTASVVHALRLFVLAEATSGYQIDRKYAVVLLRNSDEQHIPGFLGNTVRFNVMDMDNMVRYIQQSHQYSHHSSS